MLISKNTTENLIIFKRICLTFIILTKKINHTLSTNLEFFYKVLFAKFI